MPNMRVVLRPNSIKVPVQILKNNNLPVVSSIRKCTSNPGNTMTSNIVHYKSHHHSYITSSVNFQSSPKRFQDEFDRRQQNKKLNLGKTVESLQLEIPDILSTLISSDLISSDIIFRICPTTHDKLPTFKGYVPYVTTAKTLQLCLTQFILNPNVKVHIRKTKIVEPNEGSRYGLYKNSTKVIFNWKTCQENCPHLFANEETSKGSRGKHTWSRLDHTALLISKNYGLVNLELTEDKIERVLSGIFVFELDENNEKIKVFTIEDVEILENKEWIETPTGSPAC